MPEIPDSNDENPIEVSPLESRNTGEVVPFIERLSHPIGPRMQLTGMYKDWYLDYASYVILERSIPHLDDGLKPVQRRILHSMRLLDDGRYNKVASIIGHTMQFHPHGDQSIGDALVQLGQKELLIDTQGNWGNILTGDRAAAARYIEARLTSFALEVVFNNKTTEWMPTYDARSQEPITLPVKFPLLLAQGAEGIAVVLSSLILPHNFNEILDAAILYLREKPFELFPDFPTGGFIDCSKYADGRRGGVVKIRAKIERFDKRTLVISEIPFSKDTGKLIDSIRKASESGKIRITKIEDNTAAAAEIVIHLASDTSPDITIDALYAFTDCEISIWPNACVIQGNKPHFLGVSDILRASVDRTKALLTQELTVRFEELEQTWHNASLERIFIENRLYLAIEECLTWESVLSTIEESLQPYLHLLRRPLVEEDIIRLTEIKIKRISKYDAKKSDELLKSTELEMKKVQDHLNAIVPYTIDYYTAIKKKYGAPFTRKTEITSFEEIEATRVVASNAKLYVDREAGFFGSDLRGGEFVCDCSDIDDVIVILRSGKYMITPLQEKRFFDKDIVYINVFTRDDERTIYNVAYRDGKTGVSYVKRCAITSLIRDREYDLTQGTPGSYLHYLTVNSNGEAETVHVSLSLPVKMKNPGFDFDFSTLAIRGRGTRGVILSKKPIASIKLKARGESTLGGIKIWLDPDVNRLNTDERGDYLGEFLQNDKILAIYADGTFQTTGFDPSTRFNEDPLHFEMFDPSRVFTAAFYEGEKQFYYLKRFSFAASETPQSFIGDHPDSKLIVLSLDEFPRLIVSFTGKNANRADEEIDAQQFIGVKSFKARGKRISTYEIGALQFGEPYEADSHTAAGGPAEGDDE